MVHFLQLLNNPVVNRICLRALDQCVSAVGAFSCIILTKNSDSTFTCTCSAEKSFRSP